MAEDPVRDEAERLVAAAIAAVSTAARGLGGDRLATGSAECCICPVCRVIAALREPSPEFTEKLAAGAGELAAGVATLLRSLHSTGRPAPEEPEPANDGDEFWERMRAQAQARYAPQTTEDTWSAATAAAPAPSTPKPPMAKKAVKKAAPAATPDPRDDAPPEAPAKARKATKKAAKSTREGDG